MTRGHDLIELEEILIASTYEKNAKTSSGQLPSFSASQFLESAKNFMPQNLILIKILEKISEKNSEDITYSELPLIGDFNDRILKKSFLKEKYLNLRKNAEKNEKKIFFEKLEKLKIYDIHENLNGLENAVKYDQSYEDKKSALEKNYSDLTKLFENFEKLPKSLIFEFLEVSEFLSFLETIRRCEAYLNSASILNDLTALLEKREPYIDTVSCFSDLSGC